MPASWRGSAPALPRPSCRVSHALRTRGGWLGTWLPFAVHASCQEAVPAGPLRRKGERPVNQPVARGALRRKRGPMRPAVQRQLDLSDRVLMVFGKAFEENLLACPAFFHAVTLPSRGSAQGNAGLVHVRVAGRLEGRRRGRFRLPGEVDGDDVAIVVAR